MELTGRAGGWKGTAPGGDLRRSSTVLLANTASTSVLGIAFWVLVARRYPPAIVGASSALLSAMLLMANVAELNLTSAMVRFLPTAGERDKAMILRCYLLVASVGAAVAVLALPLLRHLGSFERILHFGAAGAVWFVAAIAAWTIFALQDAVAIALRGSVWVLLENSAYGLAKLGAVAALAAVAPRLGIVVGWTVPMAATIPLMALVTFGRLVPANRRLGAVREEVSVRTLRRFVTYEYLTGTTGLATATGIQLLVISLLGARQSAYFYVVWVAVTTLDVALYNVGGSFIAEAARQPGRLADHARSVLAHLTLLVAPAVAICLAAAPTILSVFGARYSAHASTLLRLVALAALPRLVVVMWMSVHRAERHVGRVFALQAALSGALVLGCGLALHYGGSLAAVGAVYLVCQASAALVLAPGLHRRIRSATAGSPDLVRAPSAGTAPSGRAPSARPLADGVPVEPSGVPAPREGVARPA
ncbi:MAG TPA: hypothetical protein VKW77_09785 [Acidimicrobiales bacterium]|nr:hypothetical protein [Acidimicrobiales bacterium]